MPLHYCFRLTGKQHAPLLVALPLACVLISSCSDGNTVIASDTDSAALIESPLISDGPTPIDVTPAPAAQVLTEQTSAGPALTEQLPIEPALADQISAEPTLAEQVPAEPALADQTSEEPTLAEILPAEPDLEDQSSAVPALAEQSPAEPALTERPSAELTTAEPSPIEPLPIFDTRTLQIPADLFQRDGYDSLNVVRIDLRTATTPGVCTEEDLSGCTLLDVNEDVDIYDSLTPEINVQLQASDYPDDGSISNAELRQRGATARQSPQKSYRVKIDKNATKWRNERRLQLNKHPTDLSRIRNKLSFDLMSNVPALPSLRTQFVNLWIDDGQGPVDFGLFTHVEALHEEFLENRGWSEDDNIYKAEQFAFSKSDLAAMAIDESGAPLDTDSFETRLEVKTGENDHTQLIAMLGAINDLEQDFENVLDRYFDRENVLNWVTVNFLLGQKDITTHNFYLYNPVGSEKFYFLPWDYDAAFYIESELADSFDNDELRKRLFYGYARGANSVFLNRYFRLPGINDDIVNAANVLRTGPLSDTEISERASMYGSIVRPFTTSQPDLAHLSVSNQDAGDRFDSRVQQLAGYVAINHQVLQEGLVIPMPHTLESPVLNDDQWLFSWSPAHDVTGHTISYDIQISSDIDFTADSIVFEMSDIPDNSVKVEYSVPESSLPDGPLFYRVIARSSNDPQRAWQVAKNKLNIDGTNWYGVQRFEQ